MKILLINDNVEEYEHWLARLNDWFIDNDVVLDFLSAEDSGQVQPFYNHLYIYLDIKAEYLDFFLLTWGEYVDHIGP